MFKIRRDGHDHEIRELTEKEAKEYELLGTAEGENEHHCLYLGVKYGKRVRERVIGYIKGPPSPEGAKRGVKISVRFYAEHGPKHWKPKNSSPNGKTRGRAER